MTPVQIDTLCILRCCGPCSASEVWMRLERGRDVVYATLDQLYLMGLASRTRLIPHVWDVSERGREVFQGLVMEAVR